MTTPRKSELSKTASAFRRAFVQLRQALPSTLRANWKTILFPIRLVPVPVALALIALVALAMILYPPVDDVPVATIGGQDVPPLACEEDETIGFVGVPDTLVCVHYENYAEPDAGGCTRPAFHAEALGVCVLAVSPTPGSMASPTAVSPALPTATAAAIVGAPSAGMVGLP